MAMTHSPIAWLAGALAAVVASAAAAYHLGYGRGVEAGLWTGGYSEQLGQAAGALIVRQRLKAQESEEALAALDAMIDAGIASHWRRVRRPHRYADLPPPDPELVDLLAAYRRAHPSTAAGTPNLDRSVSEYLAHRDAPDTAE